MESSGDSEITANKGFLGSIRFDLNRIEPKKSTVKKLIGAAERARRFGGAPRASQRSCATKARGR